jgi:hypothetical protein
VKKHLPRLVALAVAVLIVLGYVGLRRFWTRRGQPLRPPMSEQQLKEEKAKRVAYWLAQPSILLLSPELDEVLDLLMTREDCLQAPYGTNAVGLNTLNDTARSDLRLAVKGLLQAYAKSDPEVVYDYMQSRREDLRKGDLAGTITALRKRHSMRASDLSSASPKQLFTLFWKSEAFQTHWKRLVVPTGCVRLWRVSRPLSNDDSSSLGWDENNVFRNTVHFNHTFAPTSGASVESTLSRDGGVTFADVKVIIQYDEARLNEPRPHYFRFWFNPADQTWHPSDLVVIPTVDGTYPFMLF